MQVSPHLDLPGFEPWESRAACKGADPALFYPELGGMTARRAKAVCARCPVRAECLDFAMRHYDRYGPGLYGVWGGLAERDRQALRMREAAA